jgi:SMC interacting uncharacterized protein involved in chromosome segregation
MDDPTLMRLIVEKIDNKLDDVGDRLARVEERQESNREEAHKRANNAGVAMSELTKVVRDLKDDVHGEMRDAADRQQALEIRVVRVEDAQKVFSKQIEDSIDLTKRTAIKAAGISGGAGIGIGGVLFSAAEWTLRKFGVLP